MTKRIIHKSIELLSEIKLFLTSNVGTIVTNIDVQTFDTGDWD